MFEIGSIIRTIRLFFARTAHLITILGYYKKGRHYEPISISGRLVEGSKRDWKDRWQSIEKVIKKYDVETILDVGCAEGFFIKKAAQDYHCFSLGIEMNDERLKLGELTRLYEGSNNYAVIRAKLDPLAIKKLPKMDVILCLSVVHHIIKSDGLNEGLSFVKALLEKTNKAFIFEIGTADEKSFFGKMPNMPMGQEVFVRKFLEDAGCKNIRVLNKTMSIKKDSTRLMFVAEPQL